MRALREHLVAGHTAAFSIGPDRETFVELVRATAGVADDDLACVALARFALQAGNLADGRDDPRGAVGELFDVLEHGWVDALGHDRE
ncbi:hypothetical protein ABH922_004768 [Rhodococcus sp. 27YEA15]|uniref:hypothetical protein n=1 Tax=Rhodococcus sp. 27YEA15 TaxID=3156259 RepID=UPI003C7A0A7A